MGGSTKPTLEQQRELLHLQAELLRLKIASERLQLQRKAARSADWQQLWSWLDTIPLSSGLALKAVARPKRWRNKVLMALLVGGLAWLRQRQD